MRTTLTAVSTLALLAASYGSANAADVYSSAKDPLPIVVGPANWTGLYFGVSGGYGQGVTSRDVDHTSIDVYTSGSYVNTYTETTPVAGAIPSGFLFGGQVGYGWQPGGIYFGTELTFHGSNIAGNSRATAVDSYADVYTGGSYSGVFDTKTAMHQRLDWITTVTGVVGVPFGNFLPYLKAGLAVGEVEETVYVDSYGRLLSRTGTDSGWTAGGGVAYKVAQNWDLFGDFSYYNLGDHSLGVTDVAYYGPHEPVTFKTASIPEDFWAVKFGVNYHPNSAYIPLK